MSKCKVFETREKKYSFIVMDKNNEPIGEYANNEDSVLKIVKKIKLIGECISSAEIATEESKKRSKDKFLIETYKDRKENNEEAHCFRIVYGDDVFILGKRYGDEGIKTIIEALCGAEMVFDPPTLDPSHPSKEDDTTEPSNIAGS